MTKTTEITTFDAADVKTTRSNTVAGNHPVRSTDEDFFDWVDITRIAELNFAATNAGAFAAEARGDNQDEAPVGLAPEMKRDVGTVMALEQVIDGMHNALYGFSYAKNGRAMQFRGLKQNLEFYVGRFSELAQTGEAFIMHEGQAPVLTERGERLNDRINGVRMLAKHLKEALATAEQAYEIANMGEAYKPRDERIAARQATAQEKAVAQAAQVAAAAAIGVNLSADI